MCEVDVDSIQYGVSLGWYEPSTGGRVEVPEVCLDSAMDLLHVDATRVLRITTKLTLARFITYTHHFKGTNSLQSLPRFPT